MRLSPKARLLTLLEELRSSYWFIPSMMTVVALVAGLVLPYLDELVGAAWVDDVGWLYTNKPEGARAVLSTIAGSMITVAGVTFSITIAAVAYASSQLGPRLLYNFMRDRGNQVTLGTFIATFVYCLMILRTIRSGDPVSNPEAVSAFVPHLAITFAVLLSLMSVGVLIYFVHHVPSSIRTTNVVTGVGEALEHKVDATFGESALEERLPDWPAGEAIVIRAGGSGSLQYIDFDALTEIATEGNLRLSTELIAGEFIMPGQALASVWSSDAINEAQRGEIAGAFVWGAHRTQTQDVRFLANELVEIAARALSPGVNDPFTAIHCIDWLATGLLPAVTGFPMRRLLTDEVGTPRVRRAIVSAHTLIDSSFGRLQTYAATDANVASHLIATLAKLASLTDNRAHRAVIKERITSTYNEARARLNAVALERVSRAFAEAAELEENLAPIAARAER